MRVDLYARMDAAQKADALAGLHAINGSPLLQSVIDEYAPRGGCEIDIPSQLLLNDPIILGDRFTNKFTSFPLTGQGSMTSQLMWGGTGTMLTYWRAKYATARGLAFRNLGAQMVGAVQNIGVHLTGPGPGTQCNNHGFEYSTFAGFDVGCQAGGGPLGTESASELSFNGVTFEMNGSGFLGASSGNTINLWFRSCAFNQNTRYGADLGTGQMGNFWGGGSTANGIATIRLNASWQETFKAECFRFELGAGEIAVVMGQGMAAEISSCKFASNTGSVPTGPVLTGFPKAVLLKANVFGQIGETGWKTIGMTGTGSEKHLEMVGNTIRNTTPFYIHPNYSDMSGMRYDLRGNTYGNPVVRQAPRKGTVVWPNMVDD